MKYILNEKKKLKEEYPFSFIKNTNDLKNINLYEKKKKDKTLLENSNGKITNNLRFFKGNLLKLKLKFEIKIKI
jgi:hypothetical protein